MQLTKLHEPLATELAAVNNLIQQKLSSKIPMIDNIAQHIVKNGGKRIRPLLVLLSANACNYKGDDHITMAVIVELIHAATLLHDDVVDASLVRRKQQTANEQWGNQAAVLVGDFLYSRAFQMMATLNDLKIMQIMAEATNTIAEGEVQQLINKSCTTITELQYLEVIRNKTAKLFEAAAESGAIIANSSSYVCTAFKHFGLHLGTAYQIIDDVLDYTSYQEELGKKQGKDIDEGKATLPIIHALQHAPAADKIILTQALTKNSSTSLTKINLILRRTKSIQYATRFAKREAQLAIEALAELPKNKFKQSCIDLANFSVERKF